MTFDVYDLEVSKGYFAAKRVDMSQVFEVSKIISYYKITDTEGNKIQIVSDPEYQNGKIHLTDISVFIII